MTFSSWSFPLMIFSLIPPTALPFTLQHRPSLRISSATSYTGSSSGSSKHGMRSTDTKLRVVEHLADCTNPAIAELFGGVSSEYCLQTDGTPTVFGGIGGLIRQAGTIGFLVMSYYFFKRSSNGIMDWDDDDDDDDIDDDAESNQLYNQNNSNMQGNGERVRPQTRRCPQCNGTGKFEFDGAETATMCDLCNGSGIIARSTKAGALGLPMSSRELWNPDNDNEDSDIRS